jgi:hypothetical protein
MQLMLCVDEMSNASNLKRRNSFMSSKRALLCGLFCFISSPSTGQLFSILDGAKLIANYSYTSEIIQVHGISNF